VDDDECEERSACLRGVGFVAEEGGAVEVLEERAAVRL
jgi:hypothetical protein